MDWGSTLTKKRLFFWVSVTLSVYVMCILIGIALRVEYCAKGNLVYETYKDLIPFFIAIPAAWLGYCFSRRLSYLQHLRALWSHLNQSFQMVLQYTYKKNTNVDDFSEVQISICTCIDEVRGSFKNIGESDKSCGLYPFEELKDIQKIHLSLSYGEKFDAANIELARHKILEKWKTVRAPFLAEFDREEPSTPSSPYIN